MKLPTLRYYGRRGLLAAPHRSNGGHRLCPPETVTVLRVIKAAQRLGFTLDEVAELRKPAPTGTTPDLGWTSVKEDLAEVDAKIADLTVIRATPWPLGARDLTPVPPVPTAHCRSPIWPIRTAMPTLPPTRPGASPRRS